MAASHWSTENAGQMEFTEASPVHVIDSCDMYNPDPNPIQKTLSDEIARVTHRDTNTTQLSPIGSAPNDLLFRCVHHVSSCNLALVHQVVDLLQLT